MNCCAHHNLPAGCNQGRACPSRDEAQDEPVYSVDSVEYGIWAVIVVCLVVIVVGLASVLGRYLPH